MHPKRENMTFFLIILLTLIGKINISFANTPAINHSTKKTSNLKKECLNNKKFSNLEIEIVCDNLYHHYNAKASSQFYDKQKAIDTENIKISEFNVLHAGMKKTRFKDFSRVAKIINKFDVIGVTELIPLVGDDLENNEKVISFLENTPGIIYDLKKQIYNLNLSLQRTESRGTRTKERNLILLQKKLIQLQEDMLIAKNLYRSPGYIKILEELHKLDNGQEWALIINPEGEGSAVSPTKELVGYFYRASLIKPKSNEYCLSLKKSGRVYSKKSAIACTIQMDAHDFDEDRSDIISRRPFLAEFISGNFSFSLITSHILFDEPGDEELQDQILIKAFGVDHYLQLRDYENGATKKKYARFAEVKITLDFIQSYFSKYSKNEDIIYMGDLNLESSNPFWEYVLSFWKDSNLYQDEKTSLSPSKIKDGKESFGGSSNYDHFIFDKSKTKECLYNGEVKTGVLNFTQGNQARLINRSYKVRSESMTSNYTFALDPKAYERTLNNKMYPILEGNQIPLTIGSKTIIHTDEFGVHKKASLGIIVDESVLSDFEESFLSRIIKSQLHIDSYYYYFAQIVSDHFPIYLNCKTK